MTDEIGTKDEAYAKLIDMGFRDRDIRKRLAEWKTDTVNLSCIVKDLLYPPDSEEKQVKRKSRPPSPTQAAPPSHVLPRVKREESSETLLPERKVVNGVRNARAEHQKPSQTHPEPLNLARRVSSVAEEGLKPHAVRVQGHTAQKKPRTDPCPSSASEPAYVTGLVVNELKKVDWESTEKILLSSITGGRNTGGLQSGSRGDTNPRVQGHKHQGDKPCNAPHRNSGQEKPLPPLGAEPQMVAPPRQKIKVPPEKLVPRRQPMAQGAIGNEKRAAASSRSFPEGSGRVQKPAAVSGSNGAKESLPKSVKVKLETRQGQGDKGVASEPSKVPLKGLNPGKKTAEAMKSPVGLQVASSKAGPSSRAGEQQHHDPADISNGRERMPIPWVNDFTSEGPPPTFHYLTASWQRQNAHIDRSMARVGEDDRCGCRRNCGESESFCACTSSTKGVFAYDSHGRLTPEFLDLVEREKNADFLDGKAHLQFCLQGQCPWISEEVTECLGHVSRTFIKECCYLCDCNQKACVNRVVQRGIQVPLQVFFTDNGRGWGLRVLEDVRKGSFLLEYVGEVLTNTEMDEQNKVLEILSRSEDRVHTFSFCLDADWATEDHLDDDNGLCLDATFKGNAARFINHRCNDANLIDVPVLIDFPSDKVFYHVAFFSRRDIKANEEITWDYSIDFQDANHPLKAFKCLCGSPTCRGKDKTSM